MMQSLPLDNLKRRPVAVGSISARDTSKTETPADVNGGSLSARAVRHLKVDSKEEGDDVTHLKKNNNHHDVEMARAFSTNSKWDDRLAAMSDEMLDEEENPSQKMKPLPMLREKPQRKRSSAMQPRRLQRLEHQTVLQPLQQIDLLSADVDAALTSQQPSASDGKYQSRHPSFPLRQQQGVKRYESIAEKAKFIDQIYIGNSASGSGDSYDGTMQIPILKKRLPHQQQRLQKQRRQQQVDKGNIEIFDSPGLLRVARMSSMDAADTLTDEGHSNDPIGSEVISSLDIVKAKVVNTNKVHFSTSRDECDVGGENAIISEQQLSEQNVMSVVSSGSGKEAILAHDEQRFDVSSAKVRTNIKGGSGTAVCKVQELALIPSRPTVPPATRHRQHPRRHAVEVVDELTRPGFRGYSIQQQPLQPNTRRGQYTRSMHHQQYQKQFHADSLPQNMQAPIFNEIAKVQERASHFNDSLSGAPVATEFLQLPEQTPQSLAASNDVLEAVDALAGIEESDPGTDDAPREINLRTVTELMVSTPPPIIHAPLGQAAKDEASNAASQLVLAAVTAANHAIDVADRSVLSPESAVVRYASLLTAAERNEIMEYQHIYFAGKSRSKKDIHIAELQIDQPEQEQLGEEGGTVQWNYDTKDGNYKAVHGDHLGYRFEVLDSLGSGSFGDVLLCRDHKLNIDVAVKVVKSTERFVRQAVREQQVLMELRVLHESESDGTDAQRRTKDALIELLEVFDFRKHKCFVFPLYGVNLYDYLKQREFKGLSMGAVKKIALQLLHALVYLRNNGIIHCDLKPENILLRDQGDKRAMDVVLIDFGSSCHVDDTPFTYIQSRFYRSPEVLLSCPYGVAIDMWSFACVLPELRTSMPLFPGNSSYEQIAYIAEVLGECPVTMKQRSNRPEKFFDEHNLLRIRPAANGMRKMKGSRDMSAAIKARRGVDDQFVSFLRDCLQWLPEERLSPEQALQHTWLQQSTAATPSTRKSNGIDTTSVSDSTVTAVGGSVTSLPSIDVDVAGKNEVVDNSGASLTTLS